MGNVVQYITRPAKASYQDGLNTGIKVAPRRVVECYTDPAIYERFQHTDDQRAWKDGFWRGVRLFNQRRNLDASV